MNNDEMYDLVRNEITTLKSINSPNIIYCKDTYEIENGADFSKGIIIITELCN